MARVVLVYPSNKFGASVQARVELPLGPLTVATPLDQASYEVRLIDQRVDPRWREHLEEELRLGPICVGVSTMTGPQLENALEVSRVVRAASATPIVWGGVHPSLLPRQTIEDEHVDVVVQGEGEETFLELVRAFEAGRALSEVEGLWYKEGGQIRSTPRRAPVDLEAQAPLAYHLVDLSHYMINVFGRGHVSLETSRGCAFKCSYCYNSGMYGSTWRALSVDAVLRRLHILVEQHGVSGVLFTDDNFFGKKERALEILRRIADELPDLAISKVDAHIAVLHSLTDDELALMRRAGVRMVMLGVETGSRKISALLNKQTDYDKLRAFNRRLRGSGIKPHYFFMMGFPTETEADLAETMELKRQLSEDNPEGVPRFNIFTPFPGTALFRICKEHGFEPPARLADWVSLNYRTVSERATWLSARQKKLIRMLHFATLLAEPNNFINPYKKTRLWVKAAATLYLPVARFRVKHLLHQLPLEIKLAEQLGVYPKQAR